MYNQVMDRTVSALAIVFLLGVESVGGAEHDALVWSAPPHTHTENPSSVTPTLTVPISATGRGHAVLRPMPVTMHFSVPTPHIIYSEK